MFGIDDSAPLPPRRPRRWIIATELAVLFLGLGLYALVYAFATPAGLDRVLRRLVGDAPVEIAVDDVNVVPWSELFHPRTWKISIAGLRVRSTLAEGPEVNAARVVVSVPDLVRAWASRDLVFDELRATALVVHAHNQRPSRGFTARKSALNAIHARIVHLADARVRVDPDPPLGLVDVAGIDGTLHDLRYLPATQELHGSAELDARYFQSGDLRLQRVVVPQATAEGHTVRFARGTFALAEGKGRLDGSIQNLGQRTALDFHILLDHARFEQLVRAAADKSSPLAGRVDAALRLRAGGELPRGQAQFSGTVALTDARFAFADRARPATVKIVDALPFIQLDEEKRMKLPPMRGNVLFRRGRVDLENVTFPAGKRTAEFEAHIEPRQFAAFVALLPERENRRNEPLGLVVHGAPGDIHVELRKKSEFQQHIAEHSTAGAESEASDTDERHGGLRLRRRKTDEAPSESPEPDAAAAPESPATTPESRRGKPLRILRNAARPSREP